MFTVMVLSCMNIAPDTTSDRQTLLSALFRYSCALFCNAVSSTPSFSIISALLPEKTGGPSPIMKPASTEIQELRRKVSGRRRLARQAAGLSKVPYGPAWLRLAPDSPLFPVASPSPGRRSSPPRQDRLQKEAHLHASDSPAWGHCLPFPGSHPQS